VEKYLEEGAVKALCMAAYQRPGILAQTLESIRANDTRDWRLFVSVDPGDRSVWDLLTTEATRIQWAAPPQLHLNLVRQGPDKNIRNAIEMGLEAGADLVTFQQDDVLLSPDCLALASWYRDLPTREQYLCLWHFNYVSNPARPVHVVESRGEGAKLTRGMGSPFYSLGWSASREQWGRFFERHWNIDPRGCDWSLSGWLDGRYLPQQKALVPALSRNQHIGREGHYTSGDYWDWIFRDHVWNQERRQRGFRVVLEGQDACRVPA
jgi:hypothetical protein